MPRHVLDAVVKIYCTHCDPNHSLPWQMKRQVWKPARLFRVPLAMSFLFLTLFAVRSDRTCVVPYHLPSIMRCCEDQLSAWIPPVFSLIFRFFQTSCAWLSSVQTRTTVAETHNIRSD